jgi:predicted nucleic acid-binding protein
LVIDVSVASKWFLRDEIHADRALRLLDDFQVGRVTLLAPEHISVEISSVLLKAVRRGRMTPELARARVSLMFALGITTISASESLNLLAFDRAWEFGCSFYDALYLAVAEAAQCRLVTADQRFGALIQGRFPGHIWIEDYQSPT